MATTSEINIVIDLILKNFNRDPILFENFLKRAKIQTEVASLDSKLRELLILRDTELSSIQDNINNKLLELNNL